MSITLASYKSNQAASSGLHVVTGAQSHTAGNLLVCAIYHQSSGNHVSLVANTALDTWSKSTSSPFQDGGIRSLEIWYTLSTAGSAVDVTTATLSDANDTYNTIAVYEFNTSTGTWTFGSDSTGSGGSGTGGAIATGTLTATNPSVIVALLELQANTTQVGGTGYTLHGEDATDPGSFVSSEYHIVTTSEAATASSSPGNWLIIGSVFSLSGGGGSTDAQEWIQRTSPRRFGYDAKVGY